MNKQWDRLIFAVAAGAMIAIATSIAQGGQKPAQRPLPPQAPPVRKEKASEWRYLMTRTLTPHDSHVWIAEECPADADWQIKLKGQDGQYVPNDGTLSLSATRRWNADGSPVWLLNIENVSDGCVEDFKVEFREKKMLEPRSGPTARGEARGASGAPGVLHAPLTLPAERPGVPLFFSARRGGGC